MSETDRFCPECGRGASDKTVSETDERELYSFGPLGVGIFHGRPGMFAWSILNRSPLPIARAGLQVDQRPSVSPPCVAV